MVDKLIGQKFNMLTVIRRVDSRNSGDRMLKMYLCRCDCGNMVVVRGHYLTTNHTKSCGCLIGENRKECVDTKKQVDEDGTRKQARKMWKDLKNMCYDKNNPNYNGCKMHELWMNFDNFYEWFCQYGIYEPCKIVRKDNKGIYSPKNCYLVRKKGIDARELPKLK